MNRRETDALELGQLHDFYSRVDTDRGRAVVAVVVELRAAREALRLAPRPPNFNTPTAAYAAALAAYDRVVAP